jgi:hypothetical protein
MPIDHTCSCGKKFRLKDEFAGKKFRCPACSTVNQAAAAPPYNPLLDELLNQPAPLPAPVLPARPRSAPSRSMTLRQLRKKWPFHFLSTVIIVLLVVGIPIVSYYAYNVHANATNSTGWPSVQGTITRSDVEESRRKARMIYTPKIEYRYAINGQEYHGARISFLSNKIDSSEEAAQEYVAKYPLNSACKIFYDPSNPSSCTLETGTSATGTLLIAVVPLLLIAVGIHFIRQLEAQHKVN